ncbi:MAG: hypothetical protein E6G77_04860, partial [Alphaproteobacteria bacterium]
MEHACRARRDAQSLLPCLERFRAGGAARQSLAPNDLKELIAWLQQNPGKATAGTVGVGGASDVNGAYFQNVTGTKFQFVPYRGSAPLNQDLVAGH